MYNLLFVLQVWSVGNPTVMKFMKDFRELFGWDFTQFSCFNQSDTMLLVSSVKTTDYMDRRGYMAIMSLVHGKFQLEAISTSQTTCMLLVSNEPRREKTGLRGFRPGPTHTRLYSYRRWLEA